MTNENAIKEIANHPPPDTSLYPSYKCPCKGCTAETGRSPSCHSTCEKYIDWHNAREKLREQERDERIWWEYQRDRDLDFIRGRKRNTKAERRKR